MAGKHGLSACEIYQTLMVGLDLRMDKTGLESMAILVSEAAQTFGLTYAEAHKRVADDVQREMPARHRASRLMPCECGCGKLTPGGKMQYAHPDVEGV